MTEPCVWKFRKQNLTKALYIVSFGILPRWKNKRKDFSPRKADFFCHFNVYP